MKVKDIIKCLQETYQPDDELVIAWWARDLFQVPDMDTQDKDREPTVEEWAVAVGYADDYGFGDHADSIMYDIVNGYVIDAVAEVMK